MATFDLKAYARRGAEVRISELEAELESIYRAFPDLARRPRRGGTSSPSATAYTEDGQTMLPPKMGGRKRRRRKPMTAAQRKAVGERMRKYWTARKAEMAAKKR